MQRIDDLEIPLGFTAHMRVTVATPPRISGTIRIDGVDLPLQSLVVGDTAIVAVQGAVDHAGDSSIPF